MELREIPIEDVFPDAKNPRKNFGDIKALAESCMLNAINPGEPVNPIVVVEDGGIYRIVDGERRYKAMQANRLARCHAVVCEDMDEANAMVAMVATDDKERLSDIERSRGVQQMLLLGVDPAKVERVGRMAKGSAAKLRQARAVVDDACDDMTLDRMLAIAEFAEAGDADAVDKLSVCRESDWERVASDIRTVRAREAACEPLRTACAEAGISLEDKAPSYSEYTFCTREDDPDGIAGAWDDLPEGSKAWLCETSYGGPEVRFYEPASVREDDPEAAARMECEHKVKDMTAHCEERMARWFARSANEDDGTPRTRAALMQKFFSHSNNGYYKEPGDHVVEFAKKHRMDATGGVRYAAAGAFAVFLYEKIGPKLPSRTASLAADTGEKPCDYDVEQIVEWTKCADALESDGYEPDDADRELRSIVEGIIARTDTKTEEEGK